MINSHHDVVKKINHHAACTLFVLFSADFRASTLSTFSPNALSGSSSFHSPTYCILNTNFTNLQTILHNLAQFDTTTKVYCKAFLFISEAIAPLNLSQLELILWMRIAFTDRPELNKIFKLLPIARIFHIIFKPFLCIPFLELKCPWQGKTRS